MAVPLPDLAGLTPEDMGVPVQERPMEVSVATGMFIGNMDAVCVLPGGVVLYVGDTRDLPTIVKEVLGKRLVEIPLVDARATSFERFAAAVMHARFLWQSCMTNGSRLLIACKMGINRSCAVAATCIVSNGFAEDAFHALRLIDACKFAYTEGTLWPTLTNPTLRTYVCFLGPLARSLYPCANSQCLSVCCVRDTTRQKMCCVCQPRDVGCLVCTNRKCLVFKGLAG